LNNGELPIIFHSLVVGLYLILWRINLRC